MMISMIELQHAESMHTLLPSQIPEFMKRFQDEIPGQTTVGPVLQAQIVPYLGINGIEIQIPSKTIPNRNYWVVICRRKNRLEDEVHLNDPDHNPTISKLLLERFLARESEPCSTEMETERSSPISVKHIRCSSKFRRVWCTTVQKNIATEPRMWNDISFLLVNNSEEILLKPKS